MLGSGLKVCGGGGWVVFKPILVISLKSEVEADQLKEYHYNENNYLFCCNTGTTSSNSVLCTSIFYIFRSESSFRTGKCESERKSQKVLK